MITLEYKLPALSINLKTNNRRTILSIINPKFYKYIKYIELQYYWIGEMVDSKEIVIVIYITTKNIVIYRLTQGKDPKQCKTF